MGKVVLDVKRTGLMGMGENPVFYTHFYPSGKFIISGDNAEV